MWAGVICLFVAFQTHLALGEDMQEIYFGGIFDDPIEVEDNSSLTNEQAFKFAVFIANREFANYGFEFKPLTRNTNSEDYSHLSGPFKARLSTCSLLNEQALVIFGSRHEEDIEMVESICEYKDVAHVITRWIYDPTVYRSIINFYPHSEYMTTAYFSLLKLSDWKSFTLFYEDNESILRLGGLLNTAKNDGIVVAVKQLDEIGEGVYRRTLKQAVRSGEKNYVIDCRIEILEEVFRQAQQVGMMTSDYKYIITNLDLQTINLEPFQYSEANITGIRIFDPQSDLVTLKSNAIIHSNFNPNFDVSKMKTETALLMDAVSVLARVISTKLSFQVSMSKELMSCDSSKSSRHGDSITNNVKTSKNLEMTGLIEFDGNGFRSNFNLEVIEVTESGINKIGNWNSSKGLTTVYAVVPDIDSETESLRNKTFTVVTYLNDPYTMLIDSSVQLFGNNRFEGYAIDLIDELAKMEGFNYTFVLRDDKKTGVKDPVTGEWSGMLGDLRSGAADLAITDLTITAEREEAVDFTEPFMNLGISILAKKPQNAPPGFFSFADPFALDTWMMIALSYAAVSISFFILGRLCPDEWTNPYPCVEEPEFLINQFSLQNSAWFAVGALMQQGTEIAPIAISTRMLAGMWWFVILIMVSSYTASLAAFLATENPINLFTDVDSLVENHEKFNIKMGAKENGATHGFFKGKDNPTYKAIAEYMEKHSEDLVSENKHGVLKAETETYAFFMESTSIEYETQRRCELKQYGSTLDDKGYGIAMRKNSTYRKRLSTAILKLQNSGDLDKLKRKWWEEKKGGGHCVTGDNDASTPPLKVVNVHGVFYVTVGGTLIGIVMVIIQMLIVTYKMSKKAKIPFQEALKHELSSAMDFDSDVKPTLQRKSASASKSSKQSKDSNNHTGLPAPEYGFLPAITKEEIND